MLSLHVTAKLCALGQVSINEPRPVWSRTAAQTCPAGNPQTAHVFGAGAAQCGAGEVETVGEARTDSESGSPDLDAAAHRSRQGLQCPCPGGGVYREGESP